MQTEVSPADIAEDAFNAATCEICEVLTGLIHTLSSLRSQLGCGPCMTPSAANRQHGIHLAQLVIESASNDKPCSVRQLVHDADEYDTLLDSEPVIEQVNARLDAMLKGLRYE